MAEHVLNTILQLRYDTYDQWMHSETILKAGEAAIAIFPNTNPQNPPRAVGIKIGNGRAYFDELPWIQALSADVYSWAKNSEKPHYDADEIGGLQEFIQQHGGGGTSGISGSSYRLIYNNNTNKYTLQYYDAETEEWTDTSSNVDLSSILKRINDLERFANGEQANLGNIEYPLIAFIYEGVNTYLNNLDYDDTAVDKQFVVEVSETNGKIDVRRRVLDASDISTGTLSTERGGTGLSRVEVDEILVGSLNGNISTKTIATNIANSSSGDIPTVGAITSYVTTATAGITGAMHFIGEATTEIRDNSRTDPQINNYNFSSVQLGDVILYGLKEFVWAGDSWHLLGDEGSYAIKGSITNSDIADEANIDISKIEDLQTILDSKVTQQEGKTLTSNDFNDEYKEKLDNIEDNAQRNVIEHIIVNSTERIPTTVNDVSNTVNIEVSEFDDNSREKLAGIAAGAEVNKIEKIVYDSVELTPNADRIVTITPNHHPEHENKIESIIINNREQPIVNKQVQITIDQEALDLNVVAGAQVPKENGIGKDEIDQIQKKLQFERIAITADVKDLKQTESTYIILDCGTSDSDAHPIN